MKVWERSDNYNNLDRLVFENLLKLSKFEQLVIQYSLKKWSKYNLRWQSNSLTSVFKSITWTATFTNFNSYHRHVLVTNHKVTSPIELDLVRDLQIRGRFQPCSTCSLLAGVPTIFLALNHSDNSPSNHLTITDGKLFGCRLELAPNGKISSRRPRRCPGRHHRGSWRSLPGENEPSDRWPFTKGCLAVDWR